MFPAPALDHVAEVAADDDVVAGAGRDRVDAAAGLGRDRLRDVERRVEAVGAVEDELAVVADHEVAAVAVFLKVADIVL